MNALVKKFGLQLVMTVVLLVSVAPLAADQAVTIDGEVNDIYQVVAVDGQIYEVGTNDAGNELVEDYIGQKVRINGTITVGEDGTKFLTVNEFEILTE